MEGLQSILWLPPHANSQVWTTHQGHWLFVEVFLGISNLVKPGGNTSQGPGWQLNLRLTSKRLAGFTSAGNVSSRLCEGHLVQRDHELQAEYNPFPALQLTSVPSLPSKVGTEACLGGNWGASEHRGLSLAIERVTGLPNLPLLAFPSQLVNPCFLSFFVFIMSH